MLVIRAMAADGLPLLGEFVECVEILNVACAPATMILIALRCFLALGIGCVLLGLLLVGLVVAVDLPDFEIDKGNRTTSFSHGVAETDVGFLLEFASCTLENKAFEVVP